MTKVERFIVCLLAVLILSACQGVPEVELSVRTCAPIPEGVASACACVLDGKAYVFGGRDKDGLYLDSVWSYDPQTDRWTNMGSTPMRPRVKSVCAVYDGAIYTGLGFGEGNVYIDSCYLREWWKWEPGTNTWTRLADYESKRTISTVPYVCDNRIYTIYGTDGCFSRDITYYDVQTDTWHTEAEDWHRAKSVFGGVGAKVQDRCFFGLGNNTSNLNQWYEVHLPTDTWMQRASLPGKGRALSACCATDQYIYIFGGHYLAGELTGGEVFADYLRYDPLKDQWERCGVMPCGRAENQIAFTINGKVYFGLGEDAEGKMIHSLYCIEE
ncbi:MAG: hypothetical protein II540_01435 [Paludibacteraceae bacterium]|nr:hypothetical protein [Paludibacteraceae bacterium]